MTFQKDLIMTKKNGKDFQRADRCHIYDKLYNAKDVRVKDYCHVTGK